MAPVVECEWLMREKRKCVWLMREKHKCVWLMREKRDGGVELPGGDTTE